MGARKWSGVWWTTAGCIGAAAIMSLLSSYLSQGGHGVFWVTLTKELGMALLIAGVLNITVEYLNRNRHDETIAEIKESVYVAALGKRLPDSIVDALRVGVFDAKVYRSEYSCQYELTRLPAEVDASRRHVRLAASQRYRLHNATSEPIDHVVRCTADRSKKFSTACGFTLLEVDGKTIDISKCVVQDEEPALCTIAHKVAISPGGSIHVRNEYVQVMPEIAFEVIVSLYASTNMEVSVVTPHADFEVTAMSSHREEPVKMSQTRYFHAWRMPSALLPCQGLTFKWEPVEAGNSESG